MEKPKGYLNSTINEYYPTTRFLTFNPGDWQCAELIKLLCDVNSDLDISKFTANELIALNPVSVARFMDDRFKDILKTIYFDDHSLGESCPHHFWTREYQQLGMDHFHMIVWINDIPIIGVSSEEEIARFIMRIVSCALPDKKTSNELYDRITVFQMHKHNNYCHLVTCVEFTRFFKFDRKVVNTFSYFSSYVIIYCNF